MGYYSFRRHKLEIYRDALLTLALHTLPMKLTRFMYATNLSAFTMNELINEMLTRKLIREVEPRELRKMGHYAPDKRTKVLYGITVKGSYVLQLLDELFKYIDSGDEPIINPPVWALRRAFDAKGITFEPPKEIKALISQEEAETVKVNEKDVIVITPNPQITGWHSCPECGRSIPSLRGLKIHISKMHKEKKQKLIAEIEKYF